MKQTCTTLLELKPKLFSSLPELEKILGHTFINKHWLAEALTHRSALVSEGLSDQMLTSERPWNERLEFLGDSVVSVVIAEFLCVQSRSLSEGDMSRMRAALVCEESLAQIARSTINLGKFIVLGASETHCEGHKKDSILADALEAVVGAVYSDAGFDTAKKVVLKLFSQALNAAKSNEFLDLMERDHKTLFQEAMQAKFKATPTYSVLKESGPAHSRLFEVAVFIEKEGAREEWGRGLGPTKKRAAQNAAMCAVERIKESTP